MSGRTGGLIGRLVVAGVAGAGARAALSGARSARWASSLDRVNHRGRTVSLTAGPALAAAASLSAGAGALAQGRARTAGAFLVAGLGAGAVGLYDDIVGSRPEHKSAKGFRGHVGALREGRVTSGLVKIVGVGAAGLVAASMLPGRSRRRLPRLRRVIEIGLGAGVVAGTANLINLLDLRPGRAIKAALVVGVPLAVTGSASVAAAPVADTADDATGDTAAVGEVVPSGAPTGSELLRARVAREHAARAASDLAIRSARRAAGAAAAGVVGAAMAVLPADLNEDVMIGDCGANSIGALLGVALAARSGLVGRAVLLAGLVGLTAASERVSFTKVIESTPGLRQLDGLGRRP
jgi:UDP-N-acetylmuramyl pentapeptide phosphotransferase/UDP-N-acetylglucosamine-1-phosphate transferase